MNYLNFEPKLKGISKCANYWKRRKLTPIGRLTVLKKFFIPMLTHLFMDFSSPKADIIKHLNETLYKFVWDWKAYIKQTIFIKGYEEGG